MRIKNNVNVEITCAWGSLRLAMASEKGLVYKNFAICAIFALNLHWKINVPSVLESQLRKSEMIFFESNSSRSKWLCSFYLFLFFGNIFRISVLMKPVPRYRELNTQPHFLILKTLFRKVRCSSYGVTPYN